jgi:glyoxylase-like metal-dependent hydrolase (beta-lactamase superfamily II)
MDLSIFEKKENTFSRRALFGTAAVGAMAMTLGASGLAKGANRQSPSGFVMHAGTYHFAVGEFQVSILSDGFFPIDPAVFAANEDPDFVKAFLDLHYIPSEQITAAINVPLVRTADALILFDTGAGVLGDIVGKLGAGLAQIGVSPNDITHVIYTHGHGDHVAGALAADGTPAFPNATYMMNQVEWDFWFNSPSSNTVDFIQNQLSVPEAQTELFETRTEIMPGIFAVTAPGHTPGHTNFLLESQGERLLIAGDTSLHYLLNLKHPEYHAAFDTDGPLGEETRRRIFNWTAEERIRIAAYHFPYPGIGHAVKSRVLGDIWEWVPAMY